MKFFKTKNKVIVITSCAECPCLNIIPVDGKTNLYSCNLSKNLEEEESFVGRYTKDDLMNVQIPSWCPLTTQELDKKDYKKGLKDKIKDLKNTIRRLKDTIDDLNDELHNINSYIHDKLLDYTKMVKTIYADCENLGSGDIK